MAITPDQAGRVTKEEIQAVEAAEREVDNLLRKGFQGTGTVRVTGPIGKLSRRCQDELLRRYREAGWFVEKKHESGDQRDPRGCPGYDYWLFKPAPAYRDAGFPCQFDPEPPPAHPWQPSPSAPPPEWPPRMC